MRCEAVLKRLDGFRTGELNRREHEQVHTHLAGCPACARELAEIEGLAANLVWLQVEAPAGILARVRGRTDDHYAAVETDLGRLWVGFNPCGVAMLDLGGRDPASFEDRYWKRFGLRPLPAELPERYVRAIRKAVAGDSPSAVQVDLSRLSTFEQSVLMLLRQIPRGEVRPYSWLAREVGRPKAVRAVGNTMAHNPVPLLLPCHRVVPAAGGIGGYAFGTALKRTLLTREGAPVDEIEQCARDGIRYIGCRGTGIFCFPTCRDARRVRPQNRVLLTSAAGASEAGFRPCRHCRPQ
ncbi:MAG: methylated-DNA--[protein]-cysteine S-methyltransferase [Acidobacteriota bacterium]|jgi:O-6-methylguanine DNA methyltransferase